MIVGDVSAMLDQRSRYPAGRRSAFAKNLHPTGNWSNREVVSEFVVVDVG